MRPLSDEELKAAGAAQRTPSPETWPKFFDEAGNPCERPGPDSPPHFLALRRFEPVAVGLQVIAEIDEPVKWLRGPAGTPMQIPDSAQKRSRLATVVAVGPQVQDPNVVVGARIVWGSYSDLQLPSVAGRRELVALVYPDEIKAVLREELDVVSIADAHALIASERARPKLATVEEEPAAAS